MIALERAWFLIRSLAVCHTLTPPLPGKSKVFRFRTGRHDCKDALLSVAAGSAYVKNFPEGALLDVLCSDPMRRQAEGCERDGAEQRSVAEAARSSTSGALECDVEVAPFALPPSSKLGSLA